MSHSILGRGKPPQRLYRWDEVIGPADSRRVPGQGITYAVLCSRHTSQHAGQALLVATEADKHRPMLCGRPERGIAAEDMLLYPMLFDHCSGDVRRRTANLLSQLCTCHFGPPDDLLLLRDGKRFESGGIVQPL